MAGTGNTLSISNGLSDAGKSALRSALNGWTDALNLKGGDTVSVNGCTDTVDISGTGNAITLSYSTLTIEKGAGATVTGDASTITAAA